MNARTILITCFISLSLLTCKDGKTQVLPAHAHNDYRHEQPMFDALSCNFKSIEVDVFVIGDSLYVAHDFDEITPGRTIRNLYLNPIGQIIKRNNGSVYGEGSELILLVDIKSDGLETYKMLDQILKEYKEFLSFYQSGKKTKKALQVIVSGNRPLNFMTSQNIRYAAYDGRILELESDIDSSIMPLVSDNWNKHFKWYGKGTMPPEEKKKLDKIVKQVHENGIMLRFWGVIDRPGNYRKKVWTELKNANVDLIGTDDLKGLEDFFLNEQMQN